jgi:hypothetical protein
LLVIAESRTARRRVDAHRQTFFLQFPDRIASIHRWFEKPDTSQPLRALWFMTDDASRRRHRVRAA